MSCGALQWSYRPTALAHNMSQSCQQSAAEVWILWPFAAPILKIRSDSVKVVNMEKPCFLNLTGKKRNRMTCALGFSLTFKCVYQNQQCWTTASDILKFQTDSSRFHCEFLFIYMTCMLWDLTILVPKSLDTSIAISVQSTFYILWTVKMWFIFITGITCTCPHCSMFRLVMWGKKLAILA